MKRIYIAHKFGGDEKNIEKIANIIRGYIKEYPDYVFMSPVHTFGFLYDDVPDYETGMLYCTELLSMCDELWVCSEDSRGVIIEREYCKNNNIPVIDKYLV